MHTVVYGACPGCATPASAVRDDRLWRAMGLAVSDLACARADWLETATKHAGTPAADAAQAILEELDLKRG